MKSLIFSLFQHSMAELLSNQLNIPIGEFTLHAFPDQETYVKIETPIIDKNIIIVDSLNHPNKKILPLLFFARTTKELGAKQVGLIAPYLSYLRQDKRFQPGEGITSAYFAEILSNHFDWLLTVDPHLHRYHDLNEIYTIPTKVVHASSVISQWIKTHVHNPILIGPDKESEQWVSDLANQINTPYLILEKIRKGDQSVEIHLPNLSQYQQNTPVLIDDIISTGQTMLETIKQLKNKNLPVCIGIHGLFSDNSYQQFLDAKIKKIVTCNTVPHISNAIDVSSLISQAVYQ